MAFLTPRHLELSADAEEKILADSIVCDDPQQIATLLYALRIIEKSKNGKVLFERPGQYVWCWYNLSDVPTTAQWTVNGICFAIQDDRWLLGDSLTLEVVGGSFCIQPT